MIINFSVQNFGSIKDKQTLSFEADKSTDLEDYYVVEINGFRLLKLALIYGANASGKTTLLKALDFLRTLVLEPAEKKTDKLQFEPFLFNKDTTKQNTILSIDFIQDSIRYFYEVELNSLAIIREELYFYNPNKANVFKRTTDIGKQLSIISFGNKINADKIFEKTLAANTLWNNTVLGGFLKTNMELKELKDTIEWFFNYLSPLVTPLTNLSGYIVSKIKNVEINKTIILQILRNADFNISNILLKEEEEKDLLESYLKILEQDKNMSKEKITELRENEKITSVSLEIEHTVKNTSYNLPYELESAGTQRYFGFAGLLSLTIDKSVAFSIDELETSLHPDLFIHFILSFLVNAKKSQIIATTHNREILNNKDIFRNDAIWITDKNEFCSTELYSLSDFDTSVIRKTTNIYNSFKSGKLGGTPNLGDIYISK